MSKRDSKNVKHEYDDVFFVEEISWGIGGRFLNLDFKTRQPEEDGITVRHKPMIMDIFQAKEFAVRMLGYLQGFEKKYGKIEKPEFMEKLEKEMKKKSRKTVSKGKSNYIG